MRKKLNITKDILSRAKIAVGMDAKPTQNTEIRSDNPLTDEPEKEKAGAATQKGASEETPEPAATADSGSKKTTRKTGGNS